jgi:hypothetical protein
MGEKKIYRDKTDKQHEATGTTGIYEQSMARAQRERRREANMKRWKREKKRKQRQVERADDIRPEYSRSANDTAQIRKNYYIFLYYLLYYFILYFISFLSILYC